MRPFWFLLVCCVLALEDKEDHISGWVVDSGEIVFPFSEILPPKHTKDVSLEVARNEWEAAQVVVAAPAFSTVSNLTWKLTPFSDDDSGREDVSLECNISPVGWVRKKHEPRFAPAGTLLHEWFPAPLLEFMTKVPSIKAAQVQILWVTVHATADVAPGNYSASLSVNSDNAGALTVPVHVRVFDFVLPTAQSLPTLWGNGELDYASFYGTHWSSDKFGNLLSMLLAHRFSVNSLYAAQAAGTPVTHGQFTSHPDFPSFAEKPEMLKSMWDRGSRLWNLGYINEGKAKEANMSLDEYLVVFCEMIDHAMETVVKANWPAEDLVLYLFDEDRNITAVQNAASKIKARFPAVKLITTARDRSYGVKGGPLDKYVDIWVPHTGIYLEDFDLIKQGRARGKEVYFYVSCCGTSEDATLDYFVEYPSLRARLLNGAASWKWQVDGFLYYSVAGWSQYNHSVIDSGPYTTWSPYGDWPDGDGQLLVPGPDGPMPTIMFEAVRDGLEDYEYYALLNTLIVEAEARHLDVHEEKLMLVISDDLLHTFAKFEKDPQVWNSHRRLVAQAIESVQGKLRL